MKKLLIALVGILLVNIAGTVKVAMAQVETPTPTPTVFATTTPTMTATPISKNLKGCRHVKKLSTRPPIFLWKPVAAHFPQAVIIAPQYYYPNMPTVYLLRNTGNNKLIEVTRGKSDGHCGNSECLHAATFLTLNSSKYYQKKYHSIIVKIAPSKLDKGKKECRYYTIPKPTKRYQYVGY